ncbi:hypothetical protein PC121_g18098 [Phytophthora cactorum]|nr:hypothetical protein PC120_g19243 [Phytophthora cactorum]KAG3050986.1 hypothetical protein PC121_g18098 [Phytophthora cactorum]KAG4042205.1 hypothetical protein PC123_g22298 [Phytophthora cactorum]
MCEALNYYEPRMRYEFFLDGLRNKQMRAVLNASMITSIPKACTLLLCKNLHLPVEEEDEFAGDGTLPSSTSSSTSTQSQMLQQLQQMNQMMLKQQQGSGTHRGFVNAVARPHLKLLAFQLRMGTLTRTLDHLISVLDLALEPRKERSCVVDVGVRAAVASIVSVGEAVVIGASVTATILWSATGRGLKAILETGNVAFLSVTSASRRATQWQYARILACYEAW